MDQRGVTPERPSSLNGSHVEEPTRELLEQIPNLELVEDSDVVAGSGRVDGAPCPKMAGGVVVDHGRDHSSD
jgi:hypothetical protein